MKQAVYTYLLYLCLLLPQVCFFSKYLEKYVYLIMTRQSFYKIKKYYVKYVSWVLEISEAHLSWSVVRNPSKLLGSGGEFPQSCPRNLSLLLQKSEA